MKYRHTIRGFCVRAYSHQKAMSIKREHEPPCYSRIELEGWLTSQALFLKLFREWEESGFLKELAPSVDRKDDYKNYSFDNIQLMTWKENFDKGRLDRKNGINRKLSKSVMQLSINGLFIKEFVSANEAGRILGLKNGNIINCCNNKYGFKTAGGFKWKYKN